jgi:hypothetical protein
MTDIWTPGPPPTPAPPITGLPPTDTWVAAEPCATDSSGGLTSIIDNITITGAPGAITSVQNDQPLWSIVLNDGTSSADFYIQRYDNTGALVDSPIAIARADGTVTFADPVMLGEDPVAPLQAATKEYCDNLASSTTPLMDGTAAVGVATSWARADHVHPTDTSRYAASNPSGYQTAAQVTASLAPYAPLASPTFTGVPAAPTASPGTNTTQLATTAFVATAVTGSTAGVTSFNSRTGVVTLSSADVTGALGFTPYNATNPAGYQTAAQVTASLAPYALTSAVPVASSTTPVMDSAAAVGTGTTWARADHVHPSDTSRYAASNPSGYQTAAQVTAVVPVASSTTPLADGVAAVGTGTTWARADHVHPLPPQAMGDNRIINGNFAINQRAYVSGTALAAAAYGHDRWKAGAAGCTYTFTAALPDTTVTITVGTLTQIIEAGMIEGGVYTVSWTGTAQARLYQGAPTGAYAASPVITASLPAGVNTIVEFNAGTLTRAKLEIGTVATPYNRQTMTKNMADCQRYYQVGSFKLDLYAAASQATGSYQSFPVTMRAAPTITPTFTTQTNGSGGGALPQGANGTEIYSTATAAGIVSLTGTFTAAIEL